MSDLAAALKGAEEALAKFARCRCEILCEQTPSCAVTMESALHSLLSAAREAEAPVCHLCHCCLDAPNRHGEILAEWVARAEEAEAALANDPARRFGLLCLSAWWNEGQPGDIDGADVQDYADRAGLWHHVDRHADGVECEWCGNDGSGCGELTDAGERAWAEAEDVPVRSAPSRIDELSMLLRESNAVCLCGCPESDHEHSPEGSSCDYDSHECVRASRAALDYATRLRAALAEEWERRERAESILRKARTWSLIWAEGPAMHDGVALRDAVDAHFGEGAYQSVAALRAAPAQPHSSRCACRTGDGPGLHDDGCPVTLPTPLDGDGRDGFNGPGPFEG